MSSSAGLRTATEAQPRADKSVLPTSTPVPTIAPTDTPGPGTPTAVPNTGCPPAGCPFTTTPTTSTTYPIFYGQIPPGGGADKPVLLFVHGLTGIAQDWWSDTAYSGVNDMYLYAYNAGYRTAFVTLQPGGGRGPDANYYLNGPILADQIKAVLQYYQVGTLDIITHSKGGIDAQDALWLNNSFSVVDTLIMLSAPNNGSALATIECTPPTGGTLSAICSVDPDYMLLFRKKVDGSIRTSPVSMWVAGGTDHGPPGSILYLSGSYLEQFGSNDGFVNEGSAVTLTRSQYLFVHSVNHDSIRVGHVSFPYIQQILQQGTSVTPIPSAG